MKFKNYMDFERQVLELKKSGKSRENIEKLCMKSFPDWTEGQMAANLDPFFSTKKYLNVSKKTRRGK